MTASWPARPSGASSATRVLLVDDDPIQRRLTRLRLIDAGFAVDSAVDADDALHQAARHPPSAILSDVLMGEVDGFELCRRIRETPSLMHVPVVLASAHFEEEADRALACGLGANALVTRTPDFAAEISALRLALSAGAPAAARAREPWIDSEHQRRMSRQLSALSARVTLSETLYRTLLAHARDAITLVDADGFVLEANRSCEQLLDVAPGCLVGHHVSEYALPTGQPWSLDAYEEGPSTGPTPVEFRRADGTTISMEWSTTLLELEGRMLVFGIGRDVTQSLRDAAALRRSEERYRSLLDRIPYVVWSCDARGRLDFVSANCEATSGFTAEERCGDPSTWSSRIHVEDRARVAAAFSSFLEGHAPYDVEYRWQRRDGRWIRIHDRASERYEQDGQIRADGVFNDVTRERELEEELRQSQKMEAIGLLAGGVAHDFNNMLAVIIGNAGFLGDELAEADPRREALDGIEEAARRAASLTRQLLAFSRKDIARCEIIEVDPVVTDVGRMLTRLIGEDVALSIVPGSEGGRVKIDRGQLEQVLMNLAVNARDAMPLGGELVLSTSVVDVPPTGPAGVPHGRYVAISARDCGTGIAPDVVHRIFEPFFTTKEPGRGTGLGLSMVYGIVHGAGGTVTVESELGRGTVFEVFLPLASGPCRPSEIDPASATRGSGTVLVVEDEELVRAVIRKILQGAGYRVLEACNAATAAERLEDPMLTVDLVVSDVVLPDINGPAMVSSLRTRRAGLKALYVSGYATHAAFSEAPAEIDRLLRKPFAASTLLARVREVLS